MDKLSLDFQSTAVVLIDLQNGIVERPLKPYLGSQVVEKSLSLTDALREKGATVVFVHVDLGNMLSLPSDAPRRDPNAPAPPASASELVTAITVHPKDLVVTKRQWGAFYGTNLDQELRRRGITTIVLGGIATNFGVESTARAALDRGYQIVFVEDAMSSLSIEAHTFSTKNIFPVMGRVRTTEQVLEEIQN